MSKNLRSAIDASEKSREKYATQEMKRQGYFIQVTGNKISTNLPYSDDVQMLKYLLSVSESEFFSQTELRNEEMKMEPTRAKAAAWSKTLLSSISNENKTEKKSNRFWQK